MKRTLLIISTLASLSFGVNAQWTQIGSDIDGEATDDWSGRSVSINSDGSVVAIGAEGNDANGSWSGHVRIYENIGGTWTQVGADLDGEGSDNNSGISVSLSDDGSIVAIGAYGNSSFSGHVRVYENIGGTWTQVGSDIDGEAALDRSGWSVSLSGDGSTVAIGAHKNDGNGTDAGHVRVYQNSGGVWAQIGSDIDGETSGDESGSSVSLSNDGSVVAIGAWRYNSSSGHVRIFQNSGGVWTQVGANIDAEAVSDRSGWSVSLDNDGSVVAIGAPHNNGAGHVRVFQNMGGAWTQVGSDIDGVTVADEFGNSVSLNSDGSVVAIGAHNSDANGSNSGQVQIYQYNGSVWTQIGANINGETTGDSSGESVSLSSNGSVVAIGAWNNDGNGSNSGHTRVYNNPSLSNVNDIIRNKLNIYPNPVSNKITIDSEETIEEIAIFNMFGELVQREISKTFIVSNLPNGVYVMNIRTNNGIIISRFIKE